MPDVLKKEGRLTPSVLFEVFRMAFRRLLRNDPLRMAGATAFFTSFALPFILIILSQVLRLFFDITTVRRELFESFAEVIGIATMRQVVSILQAFRELASNLLVTVVGVFFLFLVSTTLLMVVKSSINQLWRIKVVHGRSFVRKLVPRLRSLLIILGTAVLFFLSILAEGMKAYLDQTITAMLPRFASYFMGLLNYLLSIVFVTLWFAVIFRMLPDAKSPWRATIVGAFVTSLLFNLGKYILRLLLVNSNLNTLYGTSASIVLLLLFVFYSSLILYYGASFTSVWAERLHVIIRPRPYAQHYKLVDLEEE